MDNGWSHRARFGLHSDAPTRMWSKKARAAIDDARRNGDGLAISDITLLELATLASKSRIHLRFVVLPISGRACVRAIGLPATYPKDLADRIIGATALVEGLPLHNADREIVRSKVIRTIW